VEHVSRLSLILADERGGASLTPDIVERLHAQLSQEGDARIVTLEGGPAGFCTGLDLDALAAQAEALRPGATGARLGRYATLLDAIERGPRPVIALVDGPVAGGGIGIAAAADLVLATPRSTFALPEALLGLIPAMAFPVLARRVGVPRARWLALGAATLSAAEALRIGLVDQVTDDLEAALEPYARRLLRMDRRALAEVKRLAADHHGPAGVDRADAVARFERLLGSRETRDRLARFASGETPWPEDGPPMQPGAAEPLAAGEP
jgi:enoyl-CoA hydratase/carnithine racemase